MKVIISSNFDLNKLDMGRVNQVGLVNSSQRLMRIAQGNAPYETGKLKQSIGVEPGNIGTATKQVRVGPRRVVYAVRREFENYKNPGRKFYMRRTHAQAANVITDEFQKAFAIVSSNLTK